VSVLAFVIAIVPVADECSIAITLLDGYVPAALPPIATMPLSVSVPLDVNDIARVLTVNADPVA
jgi:hypothetical protein